MLKKMGLKQLPRVRPVIIVRVLYELKGEEKMRLLLLNKETSML